MINHIPKCISQNKPCGLHKNGSYLKWGCSDKYDPEQRKKVYNSKKKLCPSCGLLMSPNAEYCSKCNGTILSKHKLGVKLSKEWVLNMKKSQIKRGEEIRNNTFILLKKIAEDYGGRCLTSEYLNSKSSLFWECALGHVFKLRSDLILSKKAWCNECRILANKSTGLKKANLIASQKNGVCLSKEYIGTHDKLEWKCERDHIWKNTLSHVAGGQWCPSCSQFLNESICKNFFEEIFQAKFPKIRPEWLISVKGKKMELDGYSEIHRIAFEYQGRQHYEKIDFYYKDDDSFKERLENDKLKAKLCEEHNIRLFAIPYYVKHDEMYDFISDLASKYEIQIASNKNLDINLIKNHSQRELSELKDFVSKKNGKCLSPNYLGSNTKLEWECQRGHMFKATPSNIKQHNSWCPYCTGRKHTIDEIKEIAKLNNGECLSKEYVNGYKKLLWRCKYGHEWQATPGSIMKNRSWCPACAGNTKYTLDKAVEIGRKIGLSSLSKNYTNNMSPMEWMCGKGHIFSSSLSNIQNRTEPCPVCKPRKIYTIIDMGIIAEKYSGKCLSKKYISMWEPLEWSCSKGHTWSTKPAYILYKKRWCPYCKKK